VLAGLQPTKITRDARLDPRTLRLRDQGRLRGQNVDGSIDSRMKASLAVSALGSATTPPASRRAPWRTRDGDSQFRSNALVRTSKNNGLIGSTGRSAPAATTPRWNPSTPLLQEAVLDRQGW
jgi:putative transposase